MNFERIYETTVLLEMILRLEGSLRRIIYTDKYNKWFSHITDKTWRNMIYKRLENIEKYGRYGKSSHGCRAKNDIFEILFEGIPLRIYFTIVDDKTIQLEDGSHKKTGSGHGGQQERVIDTLDKVISARKAK